ATDLWLADSEGTVLKRVTSDGHSYCPVWSSAGDQFAYVSRGCPQIVDLHTNKSISTDVLVDQPQDIDWDASLNCSWSDDDHGLAIDDEAGRGLTVIETRTGNAVFASSGFASFSWRGGAVLTVEAYGTVEFNWSKIGTNLKPSCVLRRTLSSLLKQVSGSGVVRVREFFTSPSGKWRVFVGEL